MAQRLGTLEEYDRFVTGKSQRLVMKRFGCAYAPKTLLVWIHGDMPEGGLATYHIPSARKAATLFSAARVLSVALMRPGYEDNEGFISGVDPEYNFKMDAATLKNIEEVAYAIKNLKTHFSPERLVTISHSGGSAVISAMLGMFPGIIDVSILIACPCDHPNWNVVREKLGKAPWTRSEEAMDWAHRVPQETRVIALTGEKDNNTLPVFTEKYIKKLQEYGVSAEFILLPGKRHNSSFKAPEVFEIIGKLLES